LVVVFLKSYMQKHQKSSGLIVWGIPRAQRVNPRRGVFFFFSFCQSAIAAIFFDFAIRLIPTVTIDNASERSERSAKIYF
jgi:hypothetical protein